MADTNGELEKPNPPAPFPTPLIPPCEEGGQRMLRFYCTEGGASKPLQIRNIQQFTLLCGTLSIPLNPP
ncbi:hypothetical protein MC7420_998 [Coleofasciculus chthonoplastes PCC 7420]|uniref:Uncharacterized protein n=1 Tax=Coleofasciculus chthonoplastes PCC 7420 TaxID=118168 RepID=B4W0A8_9CYAN|nr:hypothetical protein MC7420_998 [Coleofasciculus chthonoplastes PCC 7420]